MEKEMNSDVVKATQDSLGKYVKRPPLTDKLLKKPPFRFLHDIITAVLKSTGFFSGLFEEEELISDNVKDKESKILFLNKILTVLIQATGRPLSVKPSKIIAGQEPEKTNEMLQCLAHALDNNITSDEAVRLYKESLNLNGPTKRDAKSPVKKSTDSRKLNINTTDKSTKVVKSDGKSNKIKQKENAKKEPPSKKSIVAPRVTSKKINEKPKLTNETNKQNKTDPDVEISHKENLELVQHEQIPKQVDISDDKDVTLDVNSDLNNSFQKEYSSPQDTPRIKDEPEQQSKIENIVIQDNLITNDGAVFDSADDIDENKLENTNASNEQQPHNIDQTPQSPQIAELDNVIKHCENNFHEQNKVQTYEAKLPETSNVKRPSSVRPPSSRPGAPRFREKHDSIISNTDNLAGGKVNIIAEKTVSEEEDDATIIIVDETDTANNVKEENDNFQASSEQHGRLVQQILDVQKEFIQAGKTQIEWQLGGQKAKDVLNQEIEQIRFNVQALSRVANPLGKLLDHIQEDVEVMRQELHQWTAAYEHASRELSKQKVTTEEYLLPLHAKIKQLDVDVAEKHDKINDLKIIIHKNACRIDKLLSSGSV